MIQNEELDYQKLFDLSLSLFCITTLDGKLKYANRSFWSLIGGNKSLFSNSRLIDLIVPEDMAKTIGFLQQLRSGNSNGRILNHFRTTNGLVALINWNCLISPNLDLLYACGMVERLENSLGDQSYFALPQSFPGEPSPLDAQQPAKANFRGRILVAEDTSVNRRLISLILNKHGFESILVENGESALNKASSERFDMIIMDMQMPVMNGYEATAAIRQLGYRGPIVSLTASDEEADLLRCYQAGCTAHLAKPFEEQAILTVLNAFIPVSAHSTGDRNRGDSIAEQYANDPEFQKITFNFVHGLPARMADIAFAAGNSDWNTLRTLAHRLRGAELFGFRELTGVASKLEKQIVKGDLESIENNVSELKRICGDIVANFGANLEDSELKP